MKKLALFVFIVFVQSSLFSQRVVDYISASDAIDSGVYLHNQEKYKEAIAVYEKVNENDPRYADALYEIGYSYYNNNEYDSAIIYLDKCIETDNVENFEIATLLKGACYDYLKKYDKSKECFEAALKKYPNSAKALHAYGISYYLQEDKQKAIDYFIKANYQNVNYAKNQKVIGLIAEEEGLLTQALLAYCNAALYQIGTGSVTNILVELEKIATKKPSQLTHKIKFCEEGDGFKEIETLLESQVALQDNYKMDVEIKYPVVRQLHLLMSMLQEYEPQNGYFDTYYVPLYKEMMKDGKFNDFIYLLFSEIDNKDIQKVLKSKSEDMTAMIKWLNEKLVLINSRELEYNNQKIETPCYFESNQKVCGTKIDGDEDGTWYYYRPNGSLKYVGNYKKGKAEGEWKYYYENGSLMSEYNFLENKKHGEYKVYYENGKRKETGNYNMDSLDGKIQYYHENGILLYDYEMKDNKTTGVYKAFSTNGKLSKTANYQNGKMEGKHVTYAVDGKRVLGSYTLKDDKVDGVFLTYFPNGTIEKEIVYTLGKYNGNYVVNYANGKAQTLGNFEDDEAQELYNYHENGKKKSRLFYKKGEVIEKWEYDYEDNLFAKYYYKGDLVSKTEYYNKSGDIVEKFSFGSNDKYIEKWFYTNHNAIEGDYKKGKKEGLWTYHYIDGTKSREEYYKDGELDGTIKTYHIDGSVELVYGMKEGKYHGKYNKYSNAGKLMLEGWYEEGDQVGMWYKYYQDGMLDEEYYVHNENIIGANKEYDLEGRLMEIYTYKEGEIVSIEQYDKKGEVMNKYDLLSPKITQKPNSLINFSMFKNERINGWFEGESIAEIEPGFYYNHKGSYISSRKNEDFTFYHENGVKSRSSHFVLDSREGLDTTYYTTGSVYIISNYLNDIKDGKETKYYNNGSKLYERNYALGIVDGDDKLYGSNGELVLVKNFKLGYLDFIIVNNAEGSLIDTQYCKNQTISIVANYKNGKKAIEDEIKNNNSLAFSSYDEKSGKLVYGYTSDENGLIKQKTTNYSNGNPMIKSEFVNGDYSGQERLYDVNGDLIMTSDYKNDKLQGKVKIYENKELKHEIEYRSNVPYEKIK